MGIENHLPAIATAASFVCGRNDNTEHAQRQGSSPNRHLPFPSTTQQRSKTQQDQDQGYGMVQAPPGPRSSSWPQPRLPAARSAIRCTGSGAIEAPNPGRQADREQKEGARRWAGVIGPRGWKGPRNTVRHGRDEIYQRRRCCIQPSSVLAPPLAVLVNTDAKMGQAADGRLTPIPQSPRRGRIMKQTKQTKGPTRNLCVMAKKHAGVGEA